MKRIYTIGYEDKEIKEFLNLLTDKRIKNLIDVRSFPKSRRSFFSKENLKKKLFESGIYYKHLGALGGLDEDDYKTRMEEESWNEAYSELLKLASENKTVIMCLEKDPMKCHRRFIVEQLEVDGWDVVHLGKGGSWKERHLSDYRSES